MAKQGAKTAVPRLRFPEFVGKPFHEVQLKDVTSESVTRNVDGLSTKSVMGVAKAEGIVPMKERLIASDIARYKVVQKDCFAYNPMRLNIGSIARWQGDSDILVSPDYVVFQCTKGLDSEIAPAYLDHFRQSGAWEKFVTEGGDGSVRVRIYYKDLARLQLTLPSLAEQKKIADCLTSLDEVIAAQGRKVEALKVHKRGLMQQLFPRKGETRPRFRFPEFRDAPEWREGALGSLTVKVGSGVTPRGGDSNYKRKGRPFVRSQNVDWGQLLLDDIVFIDESTHESFNGTEIADSDVLLTITGASIGRSAIADYRIVGGNVNQHVCIIRTNQSELNPVLLSHFLISERGKEQIDGFQAGGNRQGLNFAQIRSFKIPLPPTSHEQKRISDCLSSLDTQINAESAQLTALKTHKQGLMQQLFPAQRAG
ncbi:MULTISPECIES: restriction endonuclease subunit S [Xanthomonas]|nr:restriction endonuclease subunit S [Xanthomonas euvesicatoria]